MGGEERERRDEIKKLVQKKLKRGERIVFDFSEGYSEENNNYWQRGTRQEFYLDDEGQLTCTTESVSSTNQTEFEHEDIEIDALIDLLVKEGVTNEEIGSSVIDRSDWTNDRDQE